MKRNKNIFISLLLIIPFILVAILTGYGMGNRDLSLEKVLHSKVKNNEITKLVYYTVTQKEVSEEAAPAWFKIIGIYKAVETDARTSEISDALLNLTYSVAKPFTQCLCISEQFGLIIILNDKSRLQFQIYHENDYYARYYNASSQLLKRERIQDFSIQGFENIVALVQGEEKSYEGYENFINSILELD